MPPQLSRRSYPLPHPHGVHVHSDLARLRSRVARACRSSVALLLVVLIALTLAPNRPIHAAGTLDQCTESALRTALAGGGLVQINCEATLSLSHTLVIEQDTEIVGRSRATILSGNGSNHVQLIRVAPGVRLVLRQLSLLNGRVRPEITSDSADAVGAGLATEEGIVEIRDAVLAGHVVEGAAGRVGEPNLGARSGGNDGTSGGSALGAAIFARGGSLLCSNVVFSVNTATGGDGGDGSAGAAGGHGGHGGDGGHGGRSAGAAIHGQRTRIVLTDCTFATNRVTAGVAGIGGAGGGGLGFPGRAGNAGNARGAALFVEEGSLTITGSTFRENAATSGGGAGGGDGFGFEALGEDGFAGGHAQGGALYCFGGSASVSNCTFFRQSLTAGEGGPGGDGSAVGFGADGGDGGPGGDATGAAIYQGESGQLVLINCTLMENRATAGAGGNGGNAGSFVARAGSLGSNGSSLGTALFSAGGSTRIRNSILGDRESAANVAGNVVDEGYNLVRDSSLRGGTGTRNEIDPMVATTLSAVGGNTAVVVAVPLSPAIDGITSVDHNGAPSVDQRGARRVAPYDIGAFETGGLLDALVLAASRTDSGAGIALSWSPNATNVVLEVTDHPNGPWKETASDGGTLRALTVPSVERAQFFRLRAR